MIITDESKNNTSPQFNVNIIPKKSGNEIIDIEFELFNNNGQITKKITKKIEVTIDDKLNIQYKIIE